MTAPEQPETTEPKIVPANLPAQIETKWTATADELPPFDARIIGVHEYYDGSRGFETSIRKCWGERRPKYWALLPELPLVNSEFAP